MAKRHQKQLWVLVIPDDGSRTLEFKLHYPVLWGAGAVLVGLLVMVCAGIVFFLQAQYWEHTARAQELDNTRLHAEVARVEELAQMVTRMKAWDQQLRSVLSTHIDLPPASYDMPAAVRDEMEVRVVTLSRRSRGGQPVSLEMRWVPSIWPVSPSIGWVTRGFESLHGVFKNRHLGIDIAAAEGTPVQATADGRVVFADVDDVLGHLVAIDHGGVYMTRYGHNSALLVHEGERVRHGQHIALVGSSGRSSGPHLHYEVIEDGRARDPRDFLSQE